MASGASGEGRRGQQQRAGDAGQVPKRGDALVTAVGPAAGEHPRDRAAELDRSERHRRAGRRPAALGEEVEDEQRRHADLADDQQRARRAQPPDARIASCGRGRRRGRAARRRIAQPDPGDDRRENERARQHQQRDVDGGRGGQRREREGGGRRADRHSRLAQPEGKAALGPWKPAEHRSAAAARGCRREHAGQHGGGEHARDSRAPAWPARARRRPAPGRRRARAARRSGRPAHPTRRRSARCRRRRR